MKSRLVITKCAGYIFWQLLLRRLRNPLIRKWEYIRFDQTEIEHKSDPTITIGLATKFVPFFSRYFFVYFPTHFLFINSYEARMIYARALYGNFKVYLYINCFCLLIINTVT